MSVKRRRDSKYYQISFRIAGRQIRTTARTTSRAAAEELEEDLRRRYWRQVQLGERTYTWDDARAKLAAECAGKKSWDRSLRALKPLDAILNGCPLTEITRENVLRIRAVLARRQHNGHAIAKVSVNRILAELRNVLNRAATDWGMIASAPKVPLFAIEKAAREGATREQIVALLAALRPHQRALAILACATGMRRGEVTKLQRAHVDLKRAAAFIPASNAKNKTARAVPLNADAIAILREWIEAPKHHPEFVFSFRGRAPIKQVSTRAWRRICASVGLPGFRFHDLRHTWASWQVMGGTPLPAVMELGGWKSLQMVMTYKHLSPGYLEQYADRSLIAPPAAAPAAETPEQGAPERRRA